MIGLYIVLGVVGLLLILMFSSLFFLYKQIFYTPHKGQNNDLRLAGLNYQGHKEEAIALIKNLQTIEYEEIAIKSFDHLKLAGYLYEIKDSKKVAIMCHGFRGTPRRDFSGGAIEMMKLGMNVILIDERGHGKSDGHSITFGVREQKDVLSWIDYVKRRFGNDIEIVLVGISMGGATVLFASNKVDSNIKIIADCPYSTPKEIICETIKKLKLSPKFFYPIVNLTSILFAHTNLNNASAFESVRESQSKILIIHGDVDTIVPYTLSQKIYIENKDKIQYELFPDAEHGISYLIDPKRYRKIIKEFLH